MKNCRCLLLLLCLTFFLTGALAESAQPVTIYEQDFLQLWDALYADYPFLPLLEEEGVNIAALQSEYAMHVQRCRDSETFLHLLQDMLARMQNLAHLDVITPRHYAEYLTLAEQGVLDEPAASLILAPDTQAAYRALPQGISPAPVSIQHPEVFYDEDTRILFLRFTSFSHQYLERDQSLVADALRQYPLAEHLVIDITGNTGGSDHYWMNNIVAPLGGSYAYTSTLYLRNTPLVQHYGLLDHSHPIDHRETVPSSIRNLSMTHYLDVPVEVATQAQPHPVRRWVLIDGGVYSAADSFAAFCKETGWATLIGYQTMGDGGQSAPVIIQLPNTKLLVRFTVAVSCNNDGSLNALAGTLPDFTPKPRETIRDCCLRLIQTRIP